jgi:hypothetical protein
MQVADVRVEEVAVPPTQEPSEHSADPAEEQGALDADWADLDHGRSGSERSSSSESGEDSYDTFDEDEEAEASEVGKGRYGVDGARRSQGG